MCRITGSSSSVIEKADALVPESLAPRVRTGGHSWRLYHNVGQPDTFLEPFTVPSWTEFERQRTERWLEYDTDGVAKAIGYTVDRTRRHECYLALRLRR